jgi:hypothetical protein
MSQRQLGHENPSFFMENKSPLNLSISQPPLTSDRFHKALISEFLWHYQLFQEAIDRVETLTEFQVQTKLHFTRSQMLVLKRKYNIDLV